MANPGARPRCRDCGAQLRRGREVGQRCDPCQRQGPRLVLPENFYDQPRLNAALAGFDFGAVFRATRAAQRWSQQTLAEFLDLEQGRIFDIENGKRHLLDLRIVVRVANQLASPQASWDSPTGLPWTVPRLMALYLPDLAGAHAVAGDTDAAVTAGHQAIDAVTALHSSRAYDRLRVLNTALQPLHTSAGVAELRDRLSTTAA